MDQIVFGLLVVRIIISIIGVVGNVVLIISVLHMTRLKTFEVFLLGLAVSNLEEIMIVDIYDIVVFFSTTSISIWSCSALKFITISGEVASILFTVLICIFRYQKMHNAAIRVITPIFMDSMKIAIGLSIGCVLLALLVGVPTYIINLDTWQFTDNSTTEDCQADFFQCPKGHCPTFNNIYKNLIIFVCHLLPLIIVTGTSSLIIKILTGQQKVAELHQDSEPAAIVAHHHHNENSVFHRSTIGILAAMAAFQLYCCLYLILQLRFTPHDFPAWSELEFLNTTFYTGIIPYIYGMGHNFFSVKHFLKH
ncbi:C-C chemokine receptor type 1 [Hoplias malabaricus]|uniref:C-C chemokine receptor type 1 n=1 Tax=Hoplias malabaricus TaxID=27720 RepID=UPI0034630B14